MSPGPAPLLHATMLVVQALEALGVPYFVGGSLASSVHGTVRTTQDADLVADLPVERVLPLVARLQPAFYVDEERVLQAVVSRRSFNVIHLASMSKIDVFVAEDTPFARAQIDRRRQLPMPGAPELRLAVASPEDVIVEKLRWFRLGGQVSERQWTDALHVVRVQADRLDRSYLEAAAHERGVADLLERLLSRA